MKSIPDFQKNPHPLPDGRATSASAPVEMDTYLASTEFIDWEHPAVHEKAKELSGRFTRKEEVARACFEFVRDEIKHSGDFQLNPVTCRASNVLVHRTGYCYAKSHLLAALLRANGIPAGLCYQRLTITDTPPFCLHGLNAIHLENHGWYRVDARGNKEGVSAEFCPPIDNLAFATNRPGEADLPGIFSEPLPVVTELLMSGRCATFQDVANCLPDFTLDEWYDEIQSNNPFRTSRQMC